MAKPTTHLVGHTADDQRHAGDDRQPEEQLVQVEATAHHERLDEGEEDGRERHRRRRHRRVGHLHRAVEGHPVERDDHPMPE